MIRDRLRRVGEALLTFVGVIVAVAVLVGFLSFVAPIGALGGLLIGLALGPIAAWAALAVYRR